MADDRKLPDDISISSISSTSSNAAQSAADAQIDPGDDVPVPPAMSAAEIDERAQVIEALRGTDATDASRSAAPPPD